MRGHPHRPELLASKAQKLHRRRWMARASVAGTLALIVVVTAAVVLRSGDTVNRIETPLNQPDQTSTTVPAPPSTDATPDITTLSPTFDQQVAQLERWYHNWPVESPGGRRSSRLSPSCATTATTLTSADSKPWAFRARQASKTCSRRTPRSQSHSLKRASSTAASTGQTASLATRPPTSRSRHPRISFRLTCCARPTSPAPAMANWAQAQGTVVLKPAVVFSGTDCAAAGFADPPTDFVADLDRRRHVEIELRAVPKDCPTEEDAHDGSHTSPNKNSATPGPPAQVHSGTVGSARPGQGSASDPTTSTGPTTRSDSSHSTLDNCDLASMTGKSAPTADLPE